MAIFEYGFGMALAAAFALAIGSAWVREHRQGVWSKKTAGTLAIVAILVGLAVGWSLQQYLDFVAASATHRY